MAIEGPPPREVISVNGQAYTFSTVGRGAAAITTLDVSGTECILNPAAGDTRNCQITVGQRETGQVDEKGKAIKVSFVTFAGFPAAAGFPAEMSIDQWNSARSVEGRLPMFETIFYIALSLIIMGVGFLKANISSMVGQLYPTGDPRRDPGFTLYYFGINLGSFWATILCGALNVQFGWWAGFGLAGVLMLVGFLVFTRGRLLFFTPGPSMLPAHIGLPPEPEKLRSPKIGPLSTEWIIYILGFAGVGARVADGSEQRRGWHDSVALVGRHPRLSRCADGD